MACVPHLKISIEGMIDVFCPLQWLMDHPKFLSNDLYIAGDSYSGIIVPLIVKRIYYGMNDAFIFHLIAQITDQINRD